MNNAILGLQLFKHVLSSITLRGMLLLVITKIYQNLSRTFLYSVQEPEAYLLYILSVIATNFDYLFMLSFVLFKACLLSKLLLACSIVASMVTYVG